jgi:tRNA threonylcarbamoyladenosine biosynthesis protein TsaB
VPWRGIVRFKGRLAAAAIFGVFCLLFTLTGCRVRRIAFFAMNILALDTCFGACSVAVKNRDREAVHEFEVRQTGHAEALMPMVERVMSRTQLAFSDLERIAVTTGPGSFTGMRIGVSAARALSLATGAPVVGFSSLEVMAQTARSNFIASGSGAAFPVRILVAVDARKDQVYAQLFGGEDLESQAQVLSPDEAAKLIPDGPVALVGSGAAMVAAHVNAHRSDVEMHFPSLQPDALCLVIMASQLVLGTPPFKPTDIRPLYLRPPDAKPQDGKSLPRLT